MLSSSACQSTRPLKAVWSFDLHFPIVASVRTGVLHVLSVGWFVVLGQAPSYAVLAAFIFGFAWGFGAICSGRSVDTTGVSMANTLALV
jgi:uncharacterized membrane protein YedE/YeeE